MKISTPLYEATPLYEGEGGGGGGTMECASRTPTIKFTQALSIVHLSLEMFLIIYIWFYGLFTSFLSSTFHFLIMISNLKNMCHIGKIFKFTQRNVRKTTCKAKKPT